jgi:putative component of toxin-antitoxin plasmid stabilization module
VVRGTRCRRGCEGDHFGKDGDVLVILLGGGKKKGQQHDIDTAHERWKDYKQRKSQEK